jgi:hypothetical protein
MPLKPFKKSLIKSQKYGKNRMKFIFKESNTITTYG